MKYPQTRTDLAERYGLCRQTISKLLIERCGITHRKRLSLNELKTFVEKIGTPDLVGKVREILKD